jgi:alkylation response protein AidB-like acyl-CoA dehydrogenase
MIDLLPNGDQTALIASVVSFLDRVAASTCPTDGDDGRQFLQTCAGLGWLAVGLGEEVGGLGMPFADEVLIFREIGRRLAGLEFLATALGARVAEMGGEPELARGLAAGELTASLAERLPYSGRTLAFLSSPTDFVLVVGTSEAELRLYDRSQMSLRPAARSIDASYHLADVVAPPDRGVVEVRSPTLINVGSLLTSAMLVGLAERARDDSVDYACARRQYGHPIGSYQAVKHRCADMAVAAEAAWSQTAVASLFLEDERDTAPFETSAAKSVAADAALENARSNIQNHGGIGYTAEHSAHLLFKRAHLLEKVFGSSRWHLSRLLTHQPTA